MIAVADILREHRIVLDNTAPGHRYAICPECSHKRQLVHQRIKCLGVTIDNAGAAWGCNHCGWKGGGKVQQPNGHAHANSHQQPRRAAEYIYRDADNQPYLRVARMEPKSFPQSRWENGKWVSGKPRGPKIPYRLPQLLEADPDVPVFICEGEKCADTVCKHGFIATSASEGAGKWTAELNKWFSGRTVYVLPDNDAPGAKHALQVAKNLYGIARDVRIVELPGLAREGDDVHDWFELGNIPETLTMLAEAAPQWSPPNQSNDRAPAPTIKSADALRTKVFKPVRYVLQPYFVEGLTLLAGRPKLGKSWMMLQTALSVSLGQCLFGTSCEQGRCLYLGLEDNERRLQSRITKLIGFSSDWPAGFAYATEWPRANDGGLDRINEWVTRTDNPRLVVVDVLAAFRSPRTNNQTPYEADYNAIQGLQTIASAANVAIVVVHHLKKGIDTGADPFEKVSGTLGQVGAADTVAVLDRDSNGTTLYLRGRDVEELEEAIEFDKATCRWRILGAAADVQRSDERKAILKVLAEAGRPIGPKDIAAATGKSRNNVDQLLFNMAAAGEVRKAERGLYTPL